VTGKAHELKRRWHVIKVSRTVPTQFVGAASGQSIALPHPEPFKGRDVTYEDGVLFNL